MDTGIDTSADTTIAPADEGWEWAIVEIFGHRRHAGRCSEEERFGTKMLRIDIPQQGNPALFGWTTLFYSGSSIFSYSLSDERSVMKVNAPYEPHRLTYRDEPQQHDDSSGEFEDGVDPSQTAMDV